VFPLVRRLLLFAKAISVFAYFGLSAGFLSAVFLGDSSESGVRFLVSIQLMIYAYLAFRFVRAPGRPLSLNSIVFLSVLSGLKLFLLFLFSVAALILVDSDELRSRVGLNAIGYAISEIGLVVPLFNALAALAHCGIGHADGNEIARCARLVHVDFDIDQMSIDAINGSAAGLKQRHAAGANSV